MTDAYEREHMPGIGAVLHRQKATLPRWALGLVVGLPIGLATVSAIGLAVAGSILSAGLVMGGAAALSLLMAGVMVTFASARLAVSEGEVQVHLGFAGPRVPLADIASVRMGPSGTKRWGIGIKMLLGARTIVSMLGDNDHAVHIERKDGSKLILVTKEPQALLSAIEEALARRDGAPPRVRIADPSDVDAVLDAEEAEAALEQAAASPRTKAADRAAR